MKRSLTTISISLLILSALPAVAAAQDRRWEVEADAGVLTAQPASGGTQTLPPAGAPIVTSTPTFPARATSSWFFGDGASLLNGVLQEFGVASRISPLDASFARLPSSRAAAFGVRVRRRLEPRRWLELGVDTLDGSPVDAAAIPVAVEAARASFTTAFAGLFSSGPFSSTSVSAQGVTAGGSYSETYYTVAVNSDVGHPGALQPYFTLGAGVVVPSGELPAATLLGHYTTRIAADVPIDETDRVSIRFTRSTTFALVVGGGVRRDLSPAWSLRVDARLLAGPDATRVHVDATPATARGTPAGFIESFTNPAIQFSNEPATGRVSSLSGAPLKDVEVFTGGVIARTVIGIAIARRF